MVRLPELEHSSHPEHVLKWINGVETPYKCDGCKQEGFHPCYQCIENGCDFHLHEQCAAVDRLSYITHPFFGNTWSIGLCVACGKGVQGFRYQSYCNKAHVIHPCCLKLPPALSAPQGDQAVNLELHKKAKCWPTSKSCLRCQNRKISKGIHGWVYVSTNDDFCYHVACVQDLILDKWRTDQLQSPNGDPGRQTIQLAIEIVSYLQGRFARCTWG
ncbi:hypothetical protein CIPAW_01G288500 [Carya illinoinensis]|uniref:DC1 domain-containing protein n=1 Tax=Carya illinoinensis TaxID=32201 RepID=A0A8T1RTM4_CARIL|nr:hypothetical protein CIPAW_01G288500 [Carya illinoinensis]KAG6734826.1 hypothetical protein I3842_01G290200 [Carya illinoinensis]